MAKKPPMQVHVQSSSFNELLASQKQTNESFMVMKDLLVKLTVLQQGEIKQKVQLRDLREKEISAMKRRNELSASEAKAIAHLASSMKSFPSIMDRLRDRGEKIQNMFKNPMGSLRTAALKATNVFGINNRRLERENFINAQRAMGSKKSFSEHAADFEGAQSAKRKIDKNEAKIAELKKTTGMSEKDLAKTEAGKSLFENRKSATDEYAKHDVRAAMIKTPAASAEKATPSQQFQDSGKSEETQNEDNKARDEQLDLLKKIEENTRGDSPRQGAKKASSPEGTEEKGGGLLSGLLGGKMANVLKSMKDFGVGIAFVAGGLWVAAKAFKSFSEVAWDDVGKGLAVLGGMIVTAKLLKNAMGDMIKAAVGIVALSGALYVSTLAFKQFAEIDWETMGKAAATIIGLGAAGMILGKNVGNMLLGALGLAAMGGALWVVGEALQTFGETTWETMGKAAVAIAGLGLASLALAPVMPLMVAAGIGLAAMGAGLWVVGEAMQAVGKGFEDMTNGLERLGQMDGDNLWNVAKGVGALGVAMAAFGAGQAAAGLGNLVGRLLTIGTDSPIEQLQKISKYGEGIGKAGAGMKDLGEGMVAFNKVDGDSLKGTMKALKEFPWEQATKFVAAGGAMSADGGKVYNASKANEDQKAENAGTKGGNNNTVIAPSTNVQNTTVQQMRPAIRNNSASGGSLGNYLDRKYALMRR